MQKNEKIFQKICKNHKNGIYLYSISKNYFRTIAFFQRKNLHNSKIFCIFAENLNHYGYT